MRSILCCQLVKNPKTKYGNDGGYEVYTISEDMLKMKAKMRDRKEGVHLEYVTSRLIVLYCTAETTEKKFMEMLSVYAQQVQQAHNKHYKVWNVSQKRHDVSCSLDALPFGWPAETAPPLEKLCTICKHIDQWMLEHPLNVAVLFCKGGLERAAIVVNSLMRYNAISANDDTVDDRFSMQRFSERYLGSEGPPSYKRYISYFTSLLSGRISVNSRPLYLHYVIIRHFEPIDIFLKIYEKLLPVYQSNTVTLKDISKLEIENTLKLRGDVFIKCIVAASSPGSSTRCLFTCQINTCTLELLDPPTQDKHQLSVIRLHKEELDLVFNDKKVDNRATLELFFGQTEIPPTIASTAAKAVTSLLPRNNSYESFEIAQDETTNRSRVEVEYSEIRKGKRNTQDESEAQHEMPVPPPVPPKPSTPIMNGEREFGSEMPERRGILPAQIREKINQKKELEGRATPSIEPDLVGKDRYDKASRCFSYVPAKSMQEAFERPRRNSVSRPIEKRENSVEHITQEELARTTIPRSYTPSSHVETPKWDEQVEDAKQAALLEELARAPSTIPNEPPYSTYNTDFEPAQIVDQAQRAAVVTPTSTLQRRASNRDRATRYGSYRTLNDDNYCSDMDDLCDPEYYLNFSNKSSPPVPPPRQQHAGARSVQLPRKKLNPNEAFIDPLDDVLESTKKLSSAYSVGDVRSAGTADKYRGNGFASNNDYRQQYRSRNCQSVNTAKECNDDETADNWLSGKLRKVKSKRDIDPDIVRRRTQEKMLLEELKDGQRNEEHNGRYRANPTIDPLAEFRREEERLRNTRSPYEEKWRGRMRGKPPTPPPRESSASPINHRMTPNLEQNRHRHNQSVPLPLHYREFDEDFDVNSLLSYPQTDASTTLDRGRSLSRGARLQEVFHSSQRDIPSNKFYSGQERVAAAIYRAETPHRDLYASGTINRAETPGRYFPENSVVLERAATPSFPVNRATPLPFHPLLYNNTNGQGTINNRSSSPRHFGSSTLSRRSSFNSVDPSEIIHHHPLFVKDTSKYWYKPTISREQAINMLRDKTPGTFVVRDSNSFPGAFGLALKVATPPPGVNPGDGTELVRHFLIEPSPKGVKLKGCNNEPVFGSLSALVYQHSITALALPTKLVLPDFDPAATPEHVNATQALLEQGAACNVVYVGSVEVESLTGIECVKRSIATCSQRVVNGESRAVSVHFKVSSQGVTLTDNTRKVFFRRHFNVQTVIFAGMDPLDRRFENAKSLGFHDGCISQARMFAFVARIPSSSENACHVFAELEPEQPATAVVNFINKVMLAQKHR